MQKIILFFHISFSISRFFQNFIERKQWSDLPSQMGVKIEKLFSATPQQPSNKTAADSMIFKSALFHPQLCRIQNGEIAL